MYSSITSVSASTAFSTRVLIMLAGFLPVTALALCTFNLIPLPVSCFWLVLPGALFISYQALRHPVLSRVIAKGFIAGIIAVLLYDLSRVPFILAGWSDFIPKIGNWLLCKEHTSPLVGYTWRYIGNGGGMGIAFAILITGIFPQRRNSWTGMGVLYGLFIFSCLMFTLFVSENGQELMFKVTPLTFTGSLIGHLIYGYVLGFCLTKFIKKI